MKRLILSVTIALAAPLAPAAAQEALPHSAEVRETSTEALQSTLYELIALRQAAHGAHWNVVGIEFYQLHEFYGELYAALDPAIDTVGARLRVLGAPADGRPGAVAENDGLDLPAPAEADGPETVAALLSLWTPVSDRLYGRIARMGDDPGTQDLLIGTVRMIDQQMWMLRAHAR